MPSKKDSGVTVDKVSSSLENENGNMASGDVENAMYGNMPRIASRVFDKPLMIAKHHLDAVMSYLGPRMNIDMPAIKGEFETRRRSFRILEGGTAVIPIIGELVHRGSWIDAMSGMTSYQRIESKFNEALADPEVKKIILEIDSPGGEVDTVFDLADVIYNARNEKPIHAVIDGMGYSAAYALASSASKIYVTRTSGSGSIGVIAQHLDVSQRNEKEGFKVTPIFAGDRKADFSPHQPLSDEAFESLRAIVFQHYELFTKTVSRNRGMSVKDVKDTQAGVFIGKAGLNHGLVDKVASAREAFAEIVKSKPSKGAFNMSTKETKPSDADAGKQISQQAKTGSPETETGSPSAETSASDSQASGADIIDIETRLKTTAEESHKKGANQERERATAITEMCNLAGLPSMAASLVNSEKTVDEARQALFAAKSESDSSQSVDGQLATESASKNHGWDDVVAASNEMYKF